MKLERIASGAFAGFGDDQMYLAELHGKLSSGIERKEDILTSNVFSFFKYSTREVFLKGYLKRLGFDISDQQAKDAEFIFWPRFSENTEPDLIIIVGDYYLLIEAKYFSGFAEATRKTNAQLLREISGGRLDAKNYSKEFRLIAITADHYYKKDKFKAIPSDNSPYFKWTNWQAISSFLSSIVETNRDIRQEEHDFALDLYSLLDKKHLRDFQGFETLCRIGTIAAHRASIFFEGTTARFRGDFIGFLNTLSLGKRLSPLSETVFLIASKGLAASFFRGFANSLPISRQIAKRRKTVFLNAQKKMFAPSCPAKKLKYIEAPIFYMEDKNHVGHK